jgi:hypothetical protein
LVLGTINGVNNTSTNKIETKSFHSFGIQFHWMYIQCVSLLFVFSFLLRPAPALQSAIKNAQQLSGFNTYRNRENSIIIGLHIRHGKIHCNSTPTQSICIGFFVF